MHHAFFHTVRKSVAHLMLLGVLFTTGALPSPAWAAAPSAANKNLTLQEDQPGGKSVLLSATGSRGETFTYAIVAQPTSGTVTLNGNSATYVPRADFFGSDSFTYQAFGSKNGASNVATVSITVNSVNDQPQATTGIVAQTTKNTPVTLSVGGTDKETSTLSCGLGTVSNGTATISGCAVTFTPKTNVTGSGSVAFRVFDGALYSTYATATINIADSNTAPIATPASVTVFEDQTKSITLQGTDVDMQTLTATLETLPEKGTFVLGTNNRGTYTPSANTCGSDRFSFTMSDGTLISNPAEVTLSITCVNDFPSATEGITFSMPENSTTRFFLTGSDADGDALTFEAEPTTIGMWSVQAQTGEATFTPPEDFEGNVTLRFRVFDGQAYSTYASVQGTVTRVNEIPIVPAQEKSLWEDIPVTFPLGGTDADMDSLSYRITDMPQRGTATLSGGSLTYTPNLHETGTDTLTVVASDGLTESAPAVMTLTIQAVNDLPQATMQEAATTENNAIALSLLGTDVDGDALSYSVASYPQHGTAEVNGATLVYTPEENFLGTDTLSYAVFDGTGYGFASITITINEPNRPEHVGTLVWSIDLGDGYVSAPPTLINNHLFFGLFEGTGSEMYSVDLAGNIVDTIDIGLHTESAALGQQQEDGTASLFVNTVHNFGNAENLYGSIPETIGEYRVIDLLGTVALTIDSSGAFQSIVWGNASTAYGRDGSPGQSEDGSVIYVADVWDPATETLYENPGSPRLTALSATTGEILQEVAQPGWSYSSPVFIPNHTTPEQNDGLVIVGAEVPDGNALVGIWGGHGGTGVLRAFPVGTDGVFSSQPLWEITDAFAPFDRGPSATWQHGRAVLFTGTMAGDIYAIEAQSGNVLWKTQLGASGFGTPVLSSDNETLFVVTDYKEESSINTDTYVSKLVALNSETGSVRWTKNIRNTAATAVVGNGVVYVTGSQEVIAVDEQTGVQLWDYDLSEKPYYGYATLVPETGLLVFGTGNHLIAIQTESTAPTTSLWGNYRGSARHEGVLWE